jgi:hypothetical protein
MNPVLILAIGAVFHALVLSAFLGEDGLAQENFFWACIAWPITDVALFGLFLRWIAKRTVAYPIRNLLDRRKARLAADAQWQKHLAVSQLAEAENLAIMGELTWADALALGQQSFKAGFIDARHLASIQASAAAEGVLDDAAEGDRI